MNDPKNNDRILYGLGAHADLPVTPEEDKAFSERLCETIRSPVLKPC